MLLKNVVFMNFSKDLNFWISVLSIILPVETSVTDLSKSTNILLARNTLDFFHSVTSWREKIYFCWRQSSLHSSKKFYPYWSVETQLETWNSRLSNVWVVFISANYYNSRFVSILPELPNNWVCSWKLKIWIWLFIWYQ